jgi:hypothetical protein
MTGAALSIDFASVMAVGQAQGADEALLAEVLPEVEPEILAGANGDPEDVEEE